MTMDSQLCCRTKSARKSRIALLFYSSIVLMWAVEGLLDAGFDGWCYLESFVLLFNGERLVELGFSLA